MEEYEEKHKEVAITLRKGEKGWHWGATPTKHLVGNALGGGNGGFATKEDAKHAIDQWLFTY